MPELPEVQTTVSGLAKVLPKLRITDVWTDLVSKSSQNKGNIKNPAYFRLLRKEITGRKVLTARRRAKNVLIDLSGNLTILIHMKMTGHLLYGKYVRVGKTWKPSEHGPLEDPFNRFVHVVFSLSNDKHLAFSDMRKFGKIVVIPTDTIEQSLHLEHIGPEPLERNFTLSKCTMAIKSKLNQKIKIVLMDQTVIAGIGNIYSDEILWHAGIHPDERVKKLMPADLKKIYAAIKSTLKLGIDFSGDSMSDYRNIHGERGKFQLHHEAYRRTGEKCRKHDDGVILRKKLGGRSAHFCSVHQRLKK